MSEAAPPDFQSITSAKMLKQQAAIWELFQTEINILRHLKTIIELELELRMEKSGMENKPLELLKRRAEADGASEPFLSFRLERTEGRDGVRSPGQRGKGTALLQENISRSSFSALHLVLYQRPRCPKVYITEQLRPADGGEHGQAVPGLSLVYLAHRSLWIEHLRPALLTARRTGQRIRPGQLASGFVRFGEIFQPCADYCCRSATPRTTCVAWRRASPLASSSRTARVDLQLKSLLTMPLQRITKYGLLLQEVLRHTEDNAERLQLETMLKSDQEEVRGVADRLEDAKMQEWREALGDEAASLLDRYRLDLTRPMPHNGQQRRKICEGELRLRDEKGKRGDGGAVRPGLKGMEKEGVWCSRGDESGEVGAAEDESGEVVPAEGREWRVERRPVPPVHRPAAAHQVRQAQAPAPATAADPLERLLIHRLTDSSSAFLLVSLTDFSSVDCLLYLVAPDQRASDDWLERLSAAVQAQSLQPAAAAAYSRHSLPPQADAPRQHLPAEPRSSTSSSSECCSTRTAAVTSTRWDTESAVSAAPAVGVDAGAPARSRKRPTPGFAEHEPAPRRITIEEEGQDKTVGRNRSRVRPIRIALISIRGPIRDSQTQLEGNFHGPWRHGPRGHTVQPGSGNSR
uniref:DH domain-containing protein n=1 Tax=Macrostomum lignano TaxID=282301 RepID=A0A1I8JLF2_9PLAT